MTIRGAFFDRLPIWGLALCGAAGLAASDGCSHQAPPPARPTAAAAARLAPVVHASARPAPSAPQGETYDNDSSKGDKEAAVFFDFDSSLLRDEARPILQKVATVANARDAAVRIEGNCDELGTTEYNLALGDQRARQAKDYLVHLGVPPSRIATVSYGAERPKAQGHDDQARAQNRRDDLILR